MRLRIGFYWHNLLGTKRLELFVLYLSDILYNHKFLDEFIINIYCMDTKNHNIFTLATYFMQQFWRLKIHEELIERGYYSCIQFHFSSDASIATAASIPHLAPVDISTLCKYLQYLPRISIFLCWDWLLCSRPVVCCMFSPEAPNLTVWLCMLTGDGSMPLSDRHKMLNA